MIHSINFEILPPTLNEMLKAAKNNWREYAQLKSDYTLDCQLYAIGAPTFSGRVWLACEWRVKTLRRDPADNTPAALKFVLDGMVAAGVIKDDSGFVIQPPVIHWWKQSKNEGVTVTISTKPIYEVTRCLD
jgi:Holliday junction resolvase RusA-like endonuclease